MSAPVRLEEAHREGCTRGELLLSESEKNALNAFLERLGYRMVLVGGRGHAAVRGVQKTRAKGRAARTAPWREQMIGLLTKLAAEPCAADILAPDSGDALRGPGEPAGLNEALAMLRAPGPPKRNVSERQEQQRAIALVDAMFTRRLAAATGPARTRITEAQSKWAGMRSKRGKNCLYVHGAELDGGPVLDSERASFEKALQHLAPDHHLELYLIFRETASWRQLDSGEVELDEANTNPFVYRKMLQWCQNVVIGKLSQNQAIVSGLKSNSVGNQ